MVSFTIFAFNSICAKSGIWFNFTTIATFCIINADNFLMQLFYILSFNAFIRFERSGLLNKLYSMNFICLIFMLPFVIVTIFAYISIFDEFCHVLRDGTLSACLIASTFATILVLEFFSIIITGFADIPLFYKEIYIFCSRAS